MTTDDEAFERLRAADPAAGTTPALDRIEAAVSEATGVPLDAALAGVPDEARAGAPGELAVRRRRRSEWLRMAAAVAAVAVLGTGGFLASGRDAGGVPTGGTALPAISLGTGGADATSNGAMAQGSSGRAASGGAAASGSPADMPTAAPGFVAYGGRTVFTGEGLSTQAGTATAWAFDASSAATAATAAHVAATLGVTGQPRADWGAWLVGPGDGSGATVRLDGSGNLSYYDPGRDPWRCQASSGTGAVGSGVSSGAAVPPNGPDAGPAPAPQPAPTMVARPVDPSVCTTGATPTGAAATSRARAVLTSLGVDTSGTQVRVDDGNEKGTGSAAAYVGVAFQQVIDGRLTGMTWNVTLVGDGVQAVNGTLATLVTLGTYPVISPAAAVDRLNDPRFGAGGGVAYAMGTATSGAGVAVPGDVASAPAATASTAAAPTAPPAPQPGTAIAWPVRRVTLVSAQLGVALTGQSDGTQTLVPAYVLTDASGATWSVVAVADDHLDFGAR